MVWPFIVLSYLSLFVFGLTDNVRGPLFPEILKAFNVSDAAGSWMFAISSVSGFFSSYFTRHLLRRYNRRAVLQGGCIALIVALLGMAWSPQFSFFLFFSVIFGLSLGILGLIPNVLVPLGASPHLKQRLLSGLHAMYGLASFCAPLMVAQIGGRTGNWRDVFLFASLGPIALFIYTFHSVHRHLHPKPTPRHLRTDAGMTLSHRWPQIFLACMVSFNVAGEILLSSRLALYMRREWSLDLADSSLYVTYFFMAMLAGRGLFAVVPFRQSIRTLLSASILSTIVVGIAGLYIHPLFLALTGLTVGPFYPLAITFISSEFPLDLDEAVSYMMATDSLMLVFMHLSIGGLTDLVGIHHALLAGLGFFAVSLIFVNTYHRVFRNI